MRGESIRMNGFRDFDCYVFGNEARGLPREALDALGAKAYAISGGGAIESLNVASAVSLCAYELSAETT